MFLRNDKSNIIARKELRKNQTPQEIILWAKIRDNKLGYKFRRQYSVGGYVLDFYCPRKMVCIEIDGSQHLENQEYDTLRTQFLNEFGIKVLRFWNKDINNNLEVVVQEIMRELNSPSPEVGEGRPKVRGEV